MKKGYALACFPFLLMLFLFLLSSGCLSTPSPPPDDGTGVRIASHQYDPGTGIFTFTLTNAGPGDRAAQFEVQAFDLQGKDTYLPFTIQTTEPFDESVNARRHCKADLQIRDADGQVSRFQYRYLKPGETATYTYENKGRYPISRYEIQSLDERMESAEGCGIRTKSVNIVQEVG